MLVAPSYRLVTEQAFPAAPDDALALLAHLQQALPTWGGRSRQLLLAGHSAGGHIAALTALRRNAWARFGLAPDLVDLLQQHGQQLDPNLVKLAEAWQTAATKLGLLAEALGTPECLSVHCGSIAAVCGRLTRPYLLPVVQARKAQSPARRMCCASWD